MVKEKWYIKMVVFMKVSLLIIKDKAMGLYVNRMENILLEVG